MVVDRMIYTDDAIQLEDYGSPEYSTVWKVEWKGYGDYDPGTE
jgi:hypothetical protein